MCRVDKDENLVWVKTMNGTNKSYYIIAAMSRPTKTDSGSYSATMYWPVRVRQPVIVLVAAPTDGSIG